ncbi:ABC transporter permease [Pseudochryseolinea flava]|uniref:ABC transporter permease n=1 Tax=Pseudochryseolinea flava TaxID=2059302 RepID=A0A364Y7K2_9BACT|nr:ABC transporter permease [Pseudochryseolinea flava]RAW02114.1 hypothetical protein DQQ10_06085 [Pseudochryseolinea flava]
MFRSVLMLLLRKSVKHFSQTIFTVVSLTIGLTCIFLIFQWATDEFRFDRYNSETDRTYAILFNETIDDEIETSDETSVPLYDLLPENLASLEAITRIDNTQSLITYNNAQIQVRGMYADSGFIQVFKPMLLYGDTEKGFRNNRSVSITSTLASTLFESANEAIGKTVLIGATDYFTITSIFEPFPTNSSFHSYQIILPFHAIKRSDEEWHNYYVKLRDTHAVARTEAMINGILQKHNGSEQTKAMLFSQAKWHLYWNFENGIATGGRIVYVKTFIAAAIFILLMSIVNYVSTATAYATKRAREIGVRKVTGATRDTLTIQFMLESLAISFIAFLVSCIASQFILPYFNQITGSDLPSLLQTPTLLIAMFCIAMITGIIAGCYPAFLLASFNPISAMRGMQLFTGHRLRKALAIFQLSLAAILIFSVAVVHQQTSYLLEKDLGYDKQNVINIWLQPEYPVPFTAFKNELLKNPAIVSAGYGGASPMEINGSAEVDWSGRIPGTTTILNGSSADEDMLDVLHMEIIQGRNFSSDRVSDSSAFIITEGAAKLMQLKDPIGQKLTYSMFGNQQGTVIGIVKDFVNDDIHAPLSPVIFCYGTEENIYNLFVRYKDGTAGPALDHLKKTFNKFHPRIPLQYSFLDADFENQFYNEYFLRRLSAWCAMIAISIAVLGLLSLVTFNTRRRTKEIGIRKIHGASNHQMLFTLLLEFIRPACWAIVIALPFTLAIIERLRQGYTHEIPIPFLFLALVAVSIILLVGAIVSLQCIRTAAKNPIDTLKTD